MINIEKPIERLIEVSNLPSHIQIWQLSEYFSKFGELEECWTVGDFLMGYICNHGFGYIKLKNLKNYEDLLNYKGDLIIENNKLILKKVFKIKTE